MNMFGFFKLQTAPVWGTFLVGATVFAGSAAYQWGTPCPTCQVPTVAPATSYETIAYVQKPCTTVNTVYKTVTSNEQVTTMESVLTTEMRTQKYTVSKPVQETKMVTETYTVEVPYSVTVYKTEKVQVTDYVEETAEQDEVQTVCQPVTRTGMREEEFTENVPVTETVMVTRTRMVPVEETGYETTIEDHGYFTEDTELKPRMMLFPSKLEWQSAKDVTDNDTGKTVHQPAGLYWVPRDTKERGTYKVKKVWVPNKVEVRKPVTRTVMKQVSEQVPQTVTRIETRTVKKMVPYTYTENVQTQVVRKVPYTVRKPVTRIVEKQVPVTETRYRKEVRTRQVPQTVCRMVQEEKIEQYPVRVCKQVPVTKTVCVTRVVPQTVTTACCPTTCCPATSANPVLPGTPTPAQRPIPPAQYQAPVLNSNQESVPQTESSPITSSSKSILNRDAEPTTYAQPTTPVENTEKKGDDVKFEQVYSADENAPSLTSQTPAATTQEAPAPQVVSQPREIKAPTAQARTTDVVPAQTNADVNAQSGQIRDSALRPAEKADSTNVTAPNSELKPIQTNGPLY